MAESYRGLTIRIGGDTTKLTQALHTANQAISGTQSSMRKLSDALKMDPGNLRASQLQVGAFASQAANAASRLTTLNDAMRQIGENVRTFHGSSATIREMAENWGNVSMKASQARDYYANLTKTIATNYTELSKLNKEAAKAAQNEFKSGFSIDKTDFDAMKELTALVDGSKAGIRAQLDSLKQMQEQYTELKNSYTDYQHIVATSADPKTFTEAAQKLAQLKTQMDTVKASFAEAAKQLSEVKFKGIDFTFDKKNVDLTSLKTGLQQVVAAGKLTQEEADKLYEKFAALKELFKGAWADVQTANEVEGFRDLEAEMAKAEAKVKSLVNEMVRLAQTSETAKGLGAIKQQLDEIVQRGNNAKSRLQEVLKVISDNNSKGIATGEGTQAAAMQAYADAVEYTDEALANLRKQLAAYDGADDWVVQLAHSTESLAGRTQEAEKGFKESATALTTFEGIAAKLKQQMDSIKASDPTNWAGSGDYQNLARQYNAMCEIIEVAKQRFAEFKKELEGLREAGEIRELRTEVSLAAESAKDLAEINFKPEVDVSAIEGLEKALKAINEFKFDAGSFSAFVDKTETSANALEAAKKKFEQLNNAAKQAPQNVTLFSQRTEALNEYMSKLNVHVYQLKRALENVPSDKVNEAAIAAGVVQENFDRANNSVSKLKDQVAALEKSIKELTDEANEIDPVDEGAKQRVKELREEIVRLKQAKKEAEGKLDLALDDLNGATITRQVAQYRTEIDAAAGVQAKLTEEAKKTSAADGTPKIDEAAFMQVVDRIAQAARHMASEVVQASNEIDTAYRDMRKTVNGTEEDFTRLKDAAIEYSQNSITSADTMLEMQALGGQLGVLTKDLEQFGRITSNLDIATDLDAEAVALKLGQISNVLNLDIDGMEGFSDALVRLGNNMPAQESAIMAVAQRFGAVASTASFSGDEILAWSAAIAATGQRSEAAATAISNTVSGIEQAVANGGSTLKQFAAIASMSSEEFVKSWQESPTQTLRAFIEGLKTLKDSDESAVAALENMGITGVRQQQTLLALTQTVNSLDKALLMSHDAWNQVDDQWGQAGDAAVEAGKKSEGFSGALAIMQNNAQNLAASLGDGMVPFMKAAADAMELVTDVLNSMPQPVKELVVLLGSAGIAFATITPMLNVFSKGMVKVIKAAGEANTIGGFLANVTGLTKVLEEAGPAGATFASVMSGPVLLGLTAAAGALVFAIDAINDYNEKQNTIKTATEGLVTATQNAKTAYDQYVIGAQESTRSTLELRDAVDQATESQARLAEEMGKAWSEVGASEATLDLLVQKITELGGQSRLSTDEQNELLAAVETFNAMTGQSVQVIDAQNGELDTSISTVKEYANAWKESTERTQHIKDYGDQIKELADKQTLLAEVNKKLEEAKTDNWFTDMRDGANGLAGSYIDLIKQQQELESDISHLETSIHSSVEGMGDIGSQVSVVERALNSVGDSLTNYGNLTDSELKTITDAYYDSSDRSVSAVERVLRALAELSGGAGKASEIASELEETSKQFRDAEAAAYKTAATAEYNRTKADFDAAYKQAQKGYDAQYKAQQKAFDNEYKAQQKAFEKQYNNLKSKLDAQYKARKAAYDKQLDALKKSQEAEVKAFQKATDAKLKEMEREYKMRLKLLEQEYGGKTGAIDDKIKALNAETEAEKKAIEERDENEKIAELQSEVQKANSRRKRAEAEKALNDYLQEIQLKHNEDSRSAEIARLEDEKDILNTELDERKAQLKEKYDADVEAYKASRAEQLEALKLANEAEYNAAKEQLDANLEALKLSQDERLTALKESQAEQLTALKEGQTAQLEAMKDAQSQALENLKASQKAQLDQLKADQDARYKQIKEGQDAESAAQDSHNKSMLDGTERSGQSMSSAIEHNLNDGVRFFQNAFDTNVKTASTSNAAINKDTDESYSKLADMAKQRGDEVDRKFAEALKAGEAFIGGNVESIANTAVAPFTGMPADFFQYGSEAAGNFASGLNSAIGWVSQAAQGIANTVYSWIHHSVPDKGPLKDDDEWGSDLVQNLIDGMRERERDLARQAEKMARIIEDGFDPTLTVDAAYEALDTIGKNRSKALGSIVETNSAPTVNVTLNMNLSDVSIREDADIEKLAKALSQEMAAQAARQLAGRLR